MPSKKKQSRTPSRLSNSELSASPKTPASSKTGVDTESFDEEELRCRIEEASSQFPCLIGKSAIIGRATDVASDSIRGFKIWLSETSMVTASLSPGSTVSVSLASMRRLSTGFPLSSIKAEYGVESEGSTFKEPGNYFVLAIVFSSSKVLKDSVRMSYNLHYGLGCPDPGRILFIHPVCSPSLTDSVNKRDGPLNSDVNHLPMFVCKELYLELIPFRNKQEVKGGLLFKGKLDSENSRESYENGSSTPKTPLNLQRQGSPGLNCPAPTTIEGSFSNVSKQRVLSSNLVDMKEVLTNESAKKLLQTCATTWLHPCSLLYGSLVAIPILSEICLFCVKKINKWQADNSKENVVILDSPSTIQTSDMDHTDYAFVINQETKVFFHHPSDSAEISKGKLVQNLQFDQDDGGEKVGCELSKLGGLSKEYAVLRDIIDSSSTKNALLSLGLRTTKGVLLHGPPGTGKTSLAQSCARDSGVNFFSVNGPEIVRQYFGESEKVLHDIFSEAGKAAPAVVFIDELDSIAPARKEGSEELSQRMVATLLNLMDGIGRSEGVVVIAATNRLDSVEPALRRPGRLDREIEIGVPSSAQRLDILHTLLNGMQHTVSDSQVRQLAMEIHGFVGADLAALCNEAALVCLRNHFDKKCSSSEETPVAACQHEGSDSSTTMADKSEDSCDSASSSEAPACSLEGAVTKGVDDIKDEERSLSIAFEDFGKARMKIKPSAMREVKLEVPKVNWDDIGGQDEVKNQLIEAVEWPQKHKDAFERIGTRPPSGILMFGPPGCSKTLMARAVASKAGLNFLAIKGPELFTKWVGESEKAVRSLFAKARANAPSIIFFDEIDSLAIVRGKESAGVSVSDRVMSQLLVELDGLQQRVGVTVIAATNRPDKIDSALLRPGRFDRLLYVGPPNETDREEIFKVHLRKIPCSSDVNLQELASMTKGCTGADISLMCREAAIAALKENFEAKEVTMRHLKSTVSEVEPTETDSYKQLSGRFQRLVVHSNDVELPETSRGNPPSSSSSTSLWTRMKPVTTFLQRLVAS